MNRSKLAELLASVADGSVSADDALASLSRLPFEDLGFARVDHHRTLRRGMPEVVYAPGKTPEQILVIVKHMVAAGTPVARIVDANPVKITAGVPERYAADVATGAKAVVTFDVLQGQEFPGTVSYAGAAVNPRNRTFPVEVVLPNPGGIIKPEMVANVAVVRRTFEDAIVIPQEALVRTEGGYIVFVVEEDAQGTLARSRSVEVGPGQNNRVLITAGLQPGDLLVVVGQQSVASEDRVNVVAEG